VHILGATVIQQETSKVLMNKLVDKFLGWKAALMNKAGCAALVHLVPSAVPVHLLIVVNLPKWFFKAVNKINKGIVWKGREKSNGGAA
jgi:cytochrome c oxidase assembly factor CtaG